MSELTLTGLTIYPVKSCANIELQHAQLDAFGLQGDRRWMVVDANGRFLSQREIAHMALIKVISTEAGLSLSFQGEEITVARPSGCDMREVQVWDDMVSALDAGDEVAAWLSHSLGQECRLVYMPDDCKRLVDPGYAKAQELVSFADGFPLLLISQASLDDLNSRLDTAVPMNRFRPNLVIEGCEPFAEDAWRRIRIGEIEFTVAKDCSRCVIPSIDQATAQKDPAINRVLAKYRRPEKKILFGQNLLHHQLGSLKLGDSCEVLEWR